MEAVQLHSASRSEPSMVRRGGGGLASGPDRHCLDGSRVLFLIVFVRMPRAVRVLNRRRVSEPSPVLKLSSEMLLACIAFIIALHRAHVHGQHAHKRD
jgi:hypothetical protein